MASSNTTNKNKNGRITWSPDTPYAATTLYQDDKVLPTDRQIAREALYSVQEISVLSATYFSAKNIQIVQNAIRKGVFDRSKGAYLIAPQDDLQLSLVMRSVYLQFCRHSVEESITDQIRALNEKVVNYAIDRIFTNVKQYMRFREDISQLPVPMEKPIDPSPQRHKTLIYNQFL